MFGYKLLNLSFFYWLNCDVECVYYCQLEVCQPDLLGDCDETHPSYRKGSVTALPDSTTPFATIVQGFGDFDGATGTMIFDENAVPKELTIYINF